MKIKCAKCGHTETVNLQFFVKALGGGITGFGYWAWIAHLFAGTGFALPICIAIITGGVALAAFSNEIVEWARKKFPCPECGSSCWEDD